MSTYKMLTGFRLAIRQPGHVLCGALIIGIIVISFCVLDGLRRGEIAKLFGRLTRSPTGRAVQLWVAKEEAGLTASFEARLSRELPELACIVPDITKTAFIGNPAPSGRHSATLLATTCEDPYLIFRGIEPPRRDQRAMIITRFLADKLAIKYAPEQDGRYRLATRQWVTLTVVRNEPAGVGEATLQAEVIGVTDADRKETATAFLDRAILDAVQSFQEGHAVERFGWPSIPSSVPVRYDSYVAFSKLPFDEADHERLRVRGLHAQALEEDEHATDQRSYCGLIDSANLAVYAIGPSVKSRAMRVGVSLPPHEVEELTDADDVLLPWSPPSWLSLADSSARAVGCSGRPRWLKEYFIQAGICFAPDAAEFAVLCSSDRLDQEGATNESAVLSFGGCDVPLTVAPDELSHELKEMIVVPAALLAHLAMMKRGEAEWDSSNNIFVRPRRENTYYQARAYANTVDDVPELDRKLQQLGFITESKRTQVEELQGYRRTLWIIVSVVAITFAVVGIFNLLVVFFDQTNRLRRSIGILRWMGVTSLDVFIFMCIRAATIAVGGAIITLLLLPVTAYLLNRHGVPCVVPPLDLAIILTAATAGCIAGVLGPAWYASRLDPAEAIAQGHNQ